MYSPSHFYSIPPFYSNTSITNPPPFYPSYIAPFFSSDNTNTAPPSYQFYPIEASSPNLSFSHEYSPPISYYNSNGSENTEHLGYYHSSNYTVSPYPQIHNTSYEPSSTTYTLPQKREAAQIINGFTEMAIPIFDGTGDGYWWILCIERYFKARGTPEAEKVSEAVTALYGSAHQWWLERQHHSNLSWESFTNVFLWWFKQEYRDVLPLLEDGKELGDDEEEAKSELLGVESSFVQKDLIEDERDTQRNEKKSEPEKQRDEDEEKSDLVEFLIVKNPPEDQSDEETKPDSNKETESDLDVPVSATEEGSDLEDEEKQPDSMLQSSLIEEENKSCSQSSLVLPFAAEFSLPSLACDNVVLIFRTDAKFCCEIFSPKFEIPNASTMTAIIMPKASNRDEDFFVDELFPQLYSAEAVLYGVELFWGEQPPPPEPPDKYSTPIILNVSLPSLSPVPFQMHLSPSDHFYLSIVALGSLVNNKIGVIIFKASTIAGNELFSLDTALLDFYALPQAREITGFAPPSHAWTHTRVINAPILYQTFLWSVPAINVIAIKAVDPKPHDLRPSPNFRSPSSIEITIHVNQFQPSHDSHVWQSELKDFLKSCQLHKVPLLNGASCLKIVGNSKFPYNASSISCLHLKIPVVIPNCQCLKLLFFQSKFSTHLISSATCVKTGFTTNFNAYGLPIKEFIFSPPLIQKKSHSPILALFYYPHVLTVEWDPGGIFLTFTMIGLCWFKQWDPGKSIIISIFLQP